MNAASKPHTLLSLRYFEHFTLSEEYINQSIVDLWGQILEVNVKLNFFTPADFRV
jgi:hypothetical protein